MFGQEYYFGGGICRDAPGATPYGMPVKTVALGSTRKSQVEFNTFLQSVSSQFSMQTYDLFSVSTYNHCHSNSSSDTNENAFARITVITFRMRVLCSWWIVIYRSIFSIYRMMR